MLSLLVVLLSVARAANPHDVTALNNMIAALTMPLNPALTPCQQTGFTCQTGRVIAVALTGTIKPAHAFPDISGFEKLQNLSFVDGWSFSAVFDLSLLGAVTWLENFAVIGDPFFNIMEWAGNQLPPQVANWESLQSCTIHYVKNMKPLPPQIVNWFSLRHFDVNGVSYTNPLQAFGMPTSVTTWSSIVTFEMVSIMMQNQDIPVLGRQPFLQTYLVSFIVPSHGFFTDLNMPKSPNLQTFILGTSFDIGGGLPVSFAESFSLVEFIVTGTALQGVVTPSFALLRKLQSYQLDGLFNGTIPADIGEATALTNLKITNGFETGSLPSQLGLLTGLTTLHITNGVLGFGVFTGVVPRELLELFNHNLTDLTIENTLIGGQLPDITLTNPPNIPASVLLRNNSLCGTLPQWLIELLPDVPTCDFSLNLFCYEPNPLLPSDTARCQAAPTVIPGNCGACPSCDPTACQDCSGTVDGSSTYDDCDVCDGDGTSCLDCSGVPNGSAQTDLCEICNGSDYCLDCDGTPFGTRTYDECDVCGGDGTSCLDCALIPFGTLEFDACNVCGGDNLTCQDCAGTPNGTYQYDVCGNCVNFSIPTYHPRCYDCLGVPFGNATRDVCGVCHNASTTHWGHHRHHHEHDGDFADGTEDECDPDEIVAGVSGLDIVVPFDIVFGAVVLILLLVYLILCVRSSESVATAPGVAHKYRTSGDAQRTSPPPLPKEFPESKAE